MPPKKAKKISLNEFLGDSGSWADEMDSLPNAPAARTDDDQSRPGDRYGRRDDFLSSRPDRVSGPPRDDVPLPTQPPYTAFIGNLAFDLTEHELGDFFTPLKTKSIKIIKDREEKPKGFGYIEFEDLEGLKDALAKSGTSFSGRTIRVSVAEPPKDRPGFGGGFEDEGKFDNPWRRDGPLPDIPGSREPSRRRFDAPSDRPDRGDRLPSLSEGADQWRSSRPARAAEPEPPTFKRKGSGFSTPEGAVSAADKEEVWTIGGKFKPTVPAPTEETGGSKFGSMRGRGDMGPPKESVADEGDWRNSARAAKPPPARASVSPSSSTPPTPVLSRRKLELLPRSGAPSATPSPLSSPKMGPTPPVSNAPRASPFGAAKPVDVSNREKEVAERLDRDRDAVKERLSMSRTNSRTASERSPLNRTRTPPPSSPNSQSPAVPNSPKQINRNLAPSVRPTLSFANAAAKKEQAAADQKANEEEKKLDSDTAVEQITDKAGELTVGQ